MEGGGGGGVKLALQDSTLPSASIVIKTYICSICIEVFLLIHELLRTTNKSEIKPIMKQR